MKKNTVKLVLIFLCFFAGITFIFSCETVDSIKRNDQEYYPVESGNYWIYEVKEEKYSLTEKPVLSTFWVKETIGNTFSDESGNDYYRVIRFIKNTQGADWKADSVWLIRQLPDKLIRIDNNILLTKLIFPVVEGSRWNTNTYNAIDQPEELSYVKVGESYTVNNKQYPLTLTVKKIRDSTALSMTRKIEVYAYETGLIHKENSYLNYCDDPSCVGSGKIDFGRRTFWTLLEKGKE